jgi:hypothetical protein
MDLTRLRLPILLWRSAAVHTVTYFMMGALAYQFLDYAERFARPEYTSWMRPTSDSLVMAGPLFQPLRGLLFGLLLWPFRERLFGEHRGWLLLGSLLVGLGILNTYGPAPGSIEGMVYTVIPIPDHLAGWLEVIPQALLYAFVLHAWVVYPERRWIGRTMTALFILALLFPVMGLVAGGIPAQ